MFKIDLWCQEKPGMSDTKKLRKPGKLNGESDTVDNTTTIQLISLTLTVDHT